jgi:hypothetical protein
MEQYYNRYIEFDREQYPIIPSITIPIKNTDKYVTFKKNKDRLDKISMNLYGLPFFGWLILLANPSVGSLEFDIEDNTNLRIPFPLITSLKDYKTEVENYYKFNGQD